MAPHRSFASAVALWTQHSPSVTEDTYDVLEEAEQVILDHQPGTWHDALSILDVLIAQGRDSRSDDRDLRALGRLRAFVGAQANVLSSLGQGGASPQLS